jgi:hypothetical protein
LKVYPLFFILSFLFVSCSGQLILNPRGCKTKASWGETQLEAEGNNFLVEKKIWIAFDRKEIRLKEYLGFEKIKCSRVNTLSMQVKTSWSDAIYSLIPLLTRKTIILEGQFKQALVMDDESKATEGP